MSWQPDASIDTLKKRAVLMAELRLFFTGRGYWEVETPALSAYGVTDVYIENIEARCLGKRSYLQTSPEYAMKRLLAAGSGPIFQIARAFRDEELGRWHNPEFTLLEWYQPGCDHHAMMDEVDCLLQSILGSTTLQRLSYQEAFLSACDLNPFIASVADCKQVLARHDLQYVLAEEEIDRDAYLFLLMVHCVEPYLARLDVPCALYGFPPSQAALAKVQHGVAERFEVYYQGIELANGFHELTDAHLQTARFKHDQQQRHARNKTARAIDTRFIQALEAGIPPCSGVALGLDRLFALALQKPAIQEVIAFGFERA